MGADVHHLHRRITPGTHPVRGRAAILADLDALHERQRILYDELAQVRDDEAGAPQRAPDLDGPIVTLGKAAGDVGWDEQKARRHIVAHNARFPHDRLGWQPGGLENGRWSIPLYRWRRYVRDLPSGPGA